VRVTRGTGYATSMDKSPRSEFGEQGQIRLSFSTWHHFIGRGSSRRRCGDQVTNAEVVSRSLRDGCLSRFKWEHEPALACCARFSRAFELVQHLVEGLGGLAEFGVVTRRLQPVTTVALTNGLGQRSH
jgi:hypothetical protein